MLEYTVGKDRGTDRVLLPWDVLGSLGHVEGLRASGLITGADHKKLRAGLRSAFRSAAMRWTTSTSRSSRACFVSSGT